jgi:hypothetical protein
MPTVNLLLIWRMRRIGMKMPYRTARAAHRTGLNLALACSLLMEESGGGTNEFGHDPTIFIGAGVVTKTKYHAYKAERQRSGNTLMQGVGPVQLTWWSTQDQADALGGCWNPYYNMMIGFEHLVENIRRDGLHAGVAAYNGSGPAAERYAEQVIARAAQYAKSLHKPWPPR